MPTRLVREGIVTSMRVDRLSEGAELFYRRLMSKVDDHGCCEARTALLRVECYPLRVDRISENDVEGWLDECIAAGLIALYVVENKAFLEILDFRQQVRAKHRRRPSSDGQVLYACYADAMQVIGQSTEILTKTKTKTKTNKPPPPPQGGATVNLTPQPPPHPGFERFWGEWPSSKRKVGKAACLAKWERHGLEALAESIVAHVRTMRESEQWREGFEPAPLTYLNQRRWEDGAPKGDKAGDDPLAGVV